MHTLIIANPISGRGKALKYLNPVCSILETTENHVETAVTGEAGDARRFASEFKGELIVSFGGDGTFNEVLNGADLNRTMLAVIPAGTGNVLAKELRIPLNPLKAAMAIKNGQEQRYDVGNANGRLFAFACGIGFDAHVIRHLHLDRSDNISQTHYLPYFLKEALKPTKWGIRIEIDDRLYAENMNMVAVSNTESYGGPLVLTPNADPCDGRFAITALRMDTPLDILHPGLAALTRGLSRCNYSRNTRGARIMVDARHPGTPFHVDGDYAGVLPLTVSIEPRRMRIVTVSEEHRRHRMLPT